MPVIVFESAERPPVEVIAPCAGRLIDLCDEHADTIPFSCRSANCGTCRIEVLEGAELLAAPADDELDVLEIFGDDPSRRRLACQVQYGAGEGRLRVRPCDD